MSDTFRTTPMRDGIRYDSRGEPIVSPRTKAGRLHRDYLYVHRQDYHDNADDPEQHEAVVADILAIEREAAALERSRIRAALPFSSGAPGDAVMAAATTITIADLLAILDRSEATLPQAAEPETGA